VRGGGVVLLAEVACDWGGCGGCGCVVGSGVGGLTPSRHPAILTPSF